MIQSSLKHLIKRLLCGHVEWPSTSSASTISRIQQISACSLATSSAAHKSTSTEFIGQPSTSAASKRPKGFLPGSHEGSFCKNVPLYMLGLDDKSVKFRAVNRLCWSDITSDATFLSFYPRSRSVSESHILSRRRAKGYQMTNTSTGSRSTVSTHGTLQRRGRRRGYALRQQALRVEQSCHGAHTQPEGSGRHSSMSEQHYHTVFAASHTPFTDLDGTSEQSAPSLHRPGSVSWNGEEEEDEEAVQLAAIILAEGDGEDEGEGEQQGASSDHMFSLGEAGGSTVFSFWRRCPLG